MRHQKASVLRQKPPQLLCAKMDLLVTRQKHVLLLAWQHFTAALPSSRPTTDALERTGHLLALFRRQAAAVSQCLSVWSHRGVEKGGGLFKGRGKLGCPGVFFTSQMEIDTHACRPGRLGNALGLVSSCSPVTCLEDLVPFIGAFNLTIL